MILYGSGGHALVVADCLFAMGQAAQGIFDDNIKSFSELKFLGPYRSDLYPEESLIISIGDNKIREELSKKIVHKFGIAVHPSAQISPKAQIGEGSVVFHQAVIQTHAKLGRHVIVNTLAGIDHQCIIEDFVHIAPNAALCGNVRIGKGTLVGAGATILPNLTIGNWCKIGAGAVVCQNIPDYSTTIGVPAQII